MVLFRGGEGTQILVLYTCTTTETSKKWLFFETERNLRELRLGVKKCLFF